MRATVAQIHVAYFTGHTMRIVPTLGDVFRPPGLYGRLNTPGDRLLWAVGETARARPSWPWCHYSWSVVTGHPGGIVGLLYQTASQ